MPIAYYYAHRADREHWSGLWSRQHFDSLLAVARRDPLSRMIESRLPKSGRILECGCGLGQYVVYLRDRGYDVTGGDYSLTALSAHRRLYPDSPLLCLDLRHMPFPDEEFQAHISLGVVEHVEEGPHELLCEFYRTLAPGGVLLLSTPWMNGYRQLYGPLIRRAQRKLSAEGALFYQYAFTGPEIRRFLKDAGFEACALIPYSPAKGMREFPPLRHLYRRITARSPERQRPRTAPVGAEGETGKVRGLRRLLYWPPMLRSFAHMVLAAAQKPER